MSNKVIDAALREFDTSTPPVPVEDGLTIDNQPAVLSENAGDVAISIRGMVTIRLNGHTLNSLTVTSLDATSKLLIIHGAVRGPLRVGAEGGDKNPQRVVFRDLRVVGGNIFVRSSGDAMLDAVSVSRTSLSPVDVVVGQELSSNIVAHALHISDCWLPTTPDPATAIRLEGGGTIELRSVMARSLSTFAPRLRCVFLKGNRVYAGNINIEGASAPRGRVDGLVPVSTTPAVLGDVRVDAHSGGESDELELPAPGGGVMVTACVGDGISRPVVASADTRTHGAVDSHFVTESA